MRIYPEVPAKRTRAMLADAAVLVLVVAFAWLGLKVNDTVDGLASLGRGVESAGGAVRSGLEDTGEAASDVPLVGPAVGDALSGAGQATGGNVASAGRAGSDAVESLARLLGWTTFLVPTLLLLVAVVPWRVRSWRRLNAAAQVLDADDEERRRLLAMRAALALPYGTLIRHTSDPIGDLASGRYDGLLRAIYEDSGLRVPTEATPS